MSRRRDKQIEARIKEAAEILRLLGMPPEQHNERSALTLLALLDLHPENTWQTARQRLIGVTPIMDFAAKLYGRSYAPNTRETFRRQTLHQFIQAGLVEINADEPSRPTNSPRNVYQITSTVLALLQAFGTSDWGHMLGERLASSATLRELYANDRGMPHVPLSLPEGRQLLQLSPGPHSQLISQIVTDFCQGLRQGRFRSM